MRKSKVPVKLLLIIGLVSWVIPNYLHFAYRFSFTKTEEFLPLTHYKEESRNNAGIWPSKISGYSLLNSVLITVQQPFIIGIMLVNFTCGIVACNSLKGVHRVIEIIKVCFWMFGPYFNYGMRQFFRFKYLRLQGRF